MLRPSRRRRRSRAHGLWYLGTCADGPRLFRCRGRQEVRDRTLLVRTRARPLCLEEDIRIRCAARARPGRCCSTVRVGVHFQDPLLRHHGHGMGQGTAGGQGILIVIAVTAARCTNKKSKGSVVALAEGLAETRDKLRPWARDAWTGCHALDRFANVAGGHGFRGGPKAQHSTCSRSWGDVPSVYAVLRTYRGARRVRAMPAPYSTRGRPARPYSNPHEASASSASPPNL